MMTIHKLSAGDGYTYYTREIASADVRRTRDQKLGDYYTADGNPPGLWAGRGAAHIGVSGTVTEEQMAALFGMGMHPDADRIISESLGDGRTAEQAMRAARLGRRYYQFDQDSGPLGDAIRETIAAFEARKGEQATASEKARIRMSVGAQAFRIDFHREPNNDAELSRYIAAHSGSGRQPVAGYDLVCSLQDLSLLWALGDEATRLQVEEAHDQAIAETLEWIEDHALLTRTGINGIAQEDVAGGIIATRFRHYDNRIGDPMLHDHIVIANKVQGRDGKWRSIDGKLLYALGVAASELYNQRAMEEVCRRLNLRVVPREITPGKRPVMSIAGLDMELREAHSRRREGIRARMAKLLLEYYRTHGTEPGFGVRIRLAQQATLEGRPGKKHARSLSDLRAAWRSDAIAKFGRLRVDTFLDRAQEAARDPENVGIPVAEIDIAEAAAAVVDRVSDDRSVWGERHILAEARRLVVRLTAGRGGTAGLAEAITEQALQHGSLLISPPDLNPAFGPLQRDDGSSIYRRREQRIYTSADVLAAEQRVLNAATTPAIPAVTQQTFERVAARIGAHLDAGQRELARVFSCSETFLAAGIGPAGAGKTTALQLVAAAVTESGGRFIALAPSARAAAVMAEDLGCTSHTVHAWMAGRTRAAGGAPGADGYMLGPGDVIVVDEAAMAGTKYLARVVEEAEQVGAHIRLLGDPWQLAAVEAGGMLRTIASRVGAVHLDQLHRFETPGEAEATLALRNGEPDQAFTWHLENGRIVGGEREAMLDALFAAWQADADAGLVALMTAEDTGTVRDLNIRAQAYRLSAGSLDAGHAVDLRDQTQAAVGDVIVTRDNDRRLGVLGGHDFVKNGDSWIVEAVHKDGAVRARHTRHGGRTVLPAPYVAAHVELGYASTVNRAQGLTVDTAHGLVTSSSSRNAAYVHASRGRRSNRLYVVTGEGQGLQDVLDTIAMSERPSESALDAIQAEQDRWWSSAQLVAEYTDVHDRATEHRIRNLARRVLGRAAEAFIASDAWSAVSRALSAAEADGWKADVLLAEAHGERDFGDAEDVSAVLSWRLNTRITEGREARARFERTPVDPDRVPWFGLDGETLQQRLAEAEGARRQALDRVVRCEARNSNAPRQVTAGGQTHPAWPHRPNGHLTRAQLAEALYRARVEARDLSEYGDLAKAARAVDRHTGLLFERDLRQAMAPLDRMREDWQREPRTGASHTAFQDPSVTWREMQENSEALPAAMQAVRDSETELDAVRAEIRLRAALPHGPAPQPDHSGDLPDWLAPAHALRAQDTPDAWRQHLAERRDILIARLAQAGASIAADPPSWTAILGPLPEADHRLRADWEYTAALADTWRTRHQILPSAPGIGPRPDATTDPADARAWEHLYLRIQALARRTRGLAAARARIDSAVGAMCIAARIAENIRLLMTIRDTEATTLPGKVTASPDGPFADPYAFAVQALHAALADGGATPQLAAWTGQVPTPDEEAPEQQREWTEIVAAIAEYRARYDIDADDALGESPEDAEQRIAWNGLTDALSLFRRARFQDRIDRIRATRADAHTPAEPAAPARDRRPRAPQPPPTPQRPRDTPHGPAKP